MKNIEVKLLNPGETENIATMAVAMARLTQKGHKIQTMTDMEELLSKPFKPETLRTMLELPHNTLRRFGQMHFAVVGASRRFLAQITRHQAGVTFMSGSLQYSDYSDDAQFCVPYEVTREDAENPQPIAKTVGVTYGQSDWHLRQYLNSCLQSMDDYRKAAKRIGNDAAGYMAPQGLRNVLIISGNLEAFKHMISLRTCNRNTLETQYVMLKIWEVLEEAGLAVDFGPPCLPEGYCPEGHMRCGAPMYVREGLPVAETILKHRFPLFYVEE